MDTDHKRPVASREPYGVAPDDMPAQDSPAQPLSESSSASVQGKAARPSRKGVEVTRPLVVMRVRSEPKKLTANGKPGAPDWSLSIGAATILFGFVIAFGSYVTLTERDAVQSRLRQSVNREDAPAALRHVPTPMPVPAQDVAQAPRIPIDASPGRYVNEGATMPNAPASSTASSQSRSLASSAPFRPATISADPLPSFANSRPAGKQAVANATSPASAQPTKSTAAEASTSTRARDPSAPPRDRRPNTKVAKAPCNTHDSCGRNIAQDETSRHRPLGTPPATKVASTAMSREATSVAATEPARQITPALTQANHQPEATSAIQSAADKGLFRQH